MDKYGKWNDLSEKLLAEIPTLKPGQTVRFQFQNGAPNLHPDFEERRKQPTIYPRTNLILKDRIWDPYGGKDGKGQMVDIGIWKDLDDKGNPINFISFLPWAYGRHPYDGVFHMIGDRENDNDVFQFLYLSNLRKDNPNARGGRTPEFELMDPAKMSREKTRKASSLRDALNVIHSMTNSEKREFAAAMLWPPELDPDTLDGQLSNMATDTPQLLMQIWGDPALKDKAVLGQAANLGVLLFDHGTKKVSYGKGNVFITKLELENGEPWVDAFFRYIKTVSGGEKHLAAIKKHIKEMSVTAEAD